MDEQLSFDARGTRGKRPVYNKHCKEHGISKLGMRIRVKCPILFPSTSTLRWTKL